MMSNLQTPQFLLDESSRKDELLDEYRKKIELLQKIITAQEELIAIKDERIKQISELYDNIKITLFKSMHNTDTLIEMTNKFFEKTDK
jgi:hypothetical protein